MNQKIVNVDWNNAKQKLTDLKSQAVTKVASRATSTKSFLSSRFEDKKNRALSSITDRGINLTKKQLQALESFKRRTSN